MMLLLPLLALNLGGVAFAIYFFKKGIFDRWFGRVPGTDFLMISLAWVMLAILSGLFVWCEKLEREEGPNLMRNFPESLNLVLGLIPLGFGIMISVFFMVRPLANVRRHELRGKEL